MNPEWPRVPLGDVLNQVAREERVDALTEYRLLGVRLEGHGAFLRETVTGSQTAATKLCRVAEGDFIYSRLFAWRGAFGVIGRDLDGCYVSGEFPTFEASSDRLDVEFLRHWFRLPPVLARVNEDCTGSTPLTRNRFKEQFFLRLEIPLPPLAEQRRVVARIEDLAAQIVTARTLREEAQRQREALIGSTVSSFFSQGAREGWKSGKLGEYVIDDRYGTSEKTSDDSSGIPILRMGNIQQGRLDFRDLKFLAMSDSEWTRLRLEPGDLLVNRTNSAELVGKCAVFDSDEEFAFASYLIRIRLDQTRADPWLVAAYINSPLGRSYMLSEKRQMTGQANVNSKKLKALPIALPPIAIQREIVRRLNDLHEAAGALAGIQSTTAAHIDALLPAILDRAFKGGL